MTLLDMHEKFTNSSEFVRYSEQTQRQYNYLLLNAFMSDFNGGAMGMLEWDQVTPNVAGAMYTEVSRNGATAANQFKTAFNAMCKTLGIESPMKAVKTITAGKESINPDMIRDLLTVAYSQFKWRNAGLLIQLTYEQGQPINKLTQCTWDDVDLDAETITVDGITVPLCADMVEMLKQQKEDFGFQPYVAPNPHPTREGYPPYGMSQLSRTLKKIKQAANLPVELNVAEIRRLGLVAMVRDGFDKAIVKGYMDPASKKSAAIKFDRLLKDV